MHNLIESQSLAPTELLQVTLLGQVRYWTNAQPGHRAHGCLDTDKVSQEILMVETDPADAEPLCRSSQPQILNSQRD